MSNRITVSAGAFIVYCPVKGGTEKQRGGWFKAEKSDQTLTRDCNVLARAIDGFDYEREQGALYHDVKFQVVKRFYATKRESQIVTEETLAAEHAQHLKGELSHTGQNA